MDWIWLIVALLVGLAVGGVVAWTVVKRRYGDRESVAELRHELDRYKGKVTEHFVETADLVNTLTRNYKRVYDHLESGAYELVGEETLRRELDAPAEAPVMLEYLGQRRSEGPVDPASTGTRATGGSKPTESNTPGSAAPPAAAAKPPARPTATETTAGAAAAADGDGTSSKAAAGPGTEGPGTEGPDSDAEERTRSAG